MIFRQPMQMDFPKSWVMAKILELWEKILELCMGKSLSFPKNTNNFQGILLNSKWRAFPKSALSKCAFEFSEICSAALGNMFECAKKTSKKIDFPKFWVLPNYLELWQKILELWLIFALSYWKKSLSYLKIC